MLEVFLSKILPEFAKIVSYVNMDKEHGHLLATETFSELRIFYANNGFKLLFEGAWDLSSENLKR